MYNARESVVELVMKTKGAIFVIVAFHAHYYL